MKSPRDDYMETKIVCADMFVRGEPALTTSITRRTPTAGRLVKRPRTKKGREARTQAHCLPCFLMVVREDGEGWGERMDHKPVAGQKNEMSDVVEV